MKRPRLIALATIALAVTGAGVGSAFAVGDAPASVTSTYTAVAPTRVLDTRHAVGVPTATPVKGNGVVALNLGADVPADATAVTLNVTVTDATGAGYLITYPAGITAPVTSTLNWDAGQTVANQVTVQLGADHTVDLLSRSAGTVDVVADLGGYFQPTADTSTAYTPTQTTWSSTNAVTDHPDSASSGGDWAVDTITRSATINLVGAAPVANCGTGATSCWLYEGTITDTGTFSTQSTGDVTVTGKSPEKGTTISGNVTGTIAGGSNVEFYASSDKPSISLVKDVTGPVMSGSPQSTVGWVQQFFPAGTTFSANFASDADLLNWTWTYTTNNTSPTQTWVNSYKGDTGDITGPAQTS